MIIKECKNDKKNVQRLVYFRNYYYLCNGIQEGDLTKVPFSHSKTTMIDVNLVEETVARYLADHADYELITCSVSPDCNIVVEVDSFKGVDLDFCAGLNRYLQEELDKTGDNYELEVGSVSLTAPFKTLMQYRKHVGHEVEILTNDGRKLHGQLVNVEPEYFEADTEMLVPVEGKKKKVRQMQTLRFAYSEVKYCKYDLKV